MGSRSPQLERLRARLRRWEHVQRGATDEFCSCGIATLDQQLAKIGVRSNALVEWLAGAEGIGTSALALQMACHACTDGRVLVIVDRRQEFYPPAAAAWGVDLRRALVVRPVSQRDEAWALVQSLRCPAVGAVFCWHPPGDVQTQRRLQLAVETGGTLGVLVRPSAARRQPSFATLRLLVEPLRTYGSRRVRVSALGIHGFELPLEFDDETCDVHPAGELADPTTARRATGA